jgi:hypothetical protein
VPTANKDVIDAIDIVVESLTSLPRPSHDELAEVVIKSYGKDLARDIALGIFDRAKKTPALREDLKAVAHSIARRVI